MDLMLDVDHDGHLTCTVVDREQTATLAAASAADALRDLGAAIAEARAAGYAECTWQLTDGEYRWLFRTTGGRVEVVILWSSGTLTGWQHVFRSEADPATLEERVADALRRIVSEGQ